MVHPRSLRYLTVCLSLLALFLATGAVEAAKRPNIILIMCDDMGFSDIGCYGGEVDTPHLNQLAREGMRFTQFYNNAKCTTTRASILTGLYPRFGKGGHLRQNMVTLGEAMKVAGYQTGLSGKWHLMKTKGYAKSKVPGGWLDRYDKTTHPYFRGFDSYYGVLDGCCNFFDPTIPDPPYKKAGIRSFGHDDKAVTEFKDGYYTTDAFTDHTLGMIRSYSQNEQPFFIHLCYTAPHYPLHAKPEDIRKYVGKFKMGWNQLRKNRWERLQELGIAGENWSLSEGDSRSYDWEIANQDFEDLRMAVYAAMIDCMDQNIGRIRETLKETGQLDNTLIVFLSDNGGCSEEPGGRDPNVRRPGPKDDYVAVGPAWGWAQNSPFRRYKSWVHEGGISTPCIAWWPGKVPANSINRSPAHIIDLLPTFLEIAQTEYPESYQGHELLPLEGTSLLSLLAGEQKTLHDSLAWYWSGNRALRQGPWKLVWDKGVKQWELYDISADRCEINNLADQHPERVQQMAQDWFTWANKVELNTKSKSK